MHTTYPPEFEQAADRMAAASNDILAALEAAGLTPETYPALPAGRPQGIAAARAYAMQGILKYHGLADWEWRTAYLPSVSVNNDAAHTLTLVEFDPALKLDEAYLNGRKIGGRALDRVRQLVNIVRDMAGIRTRVRVSTRNFVRARKMGKGLGTSAAASAALAKATLAAAFGSDVSANNRLVSCTARLLAGSGARSAAGGVALWLSYPGIAHEDSFAVRLDTANQLDELRLITVPLHSRIGLKTEQAHRDAPASPFFRAWMEARCADVLECLAAVQAGDWQALGRLAELDSIRLHGVTMSGSRENKLFAWEAENIALFRLCNTLRSAGVPVYFSTDTGPTTVFLTHSDHVEDVVAGIETLSLGVEIVRGGIGGPAELVSVDEARNELAG
ncbi:MAG: diphosphomevalonate/mevalonate 3,5-bisphosphate decarboxylase family protein [Anaerolineales bacterium]